MFKPVDFFFGTKIRPGREMSRRFITGKLQVEIFIRVQGVFSLTFVD